MLLLIFDRERGVRRSRARSAFHLDRQWVISSTRSRLRASSCCRRCSISTIGARLAIGWDSHGRFVRRRVSRRGVLVAMRALQGLGAAIVTPSAMAILMEISHPATSVTALGWEYVGSGIAAGMLVGGVLVQYLGGGRCSS